MKRGLKANNIPFIRLFQPHNSMKRGLKDRLVPADVTTTEWNSSMKRGLKVALIRLCMVNVTLNKLDEKRIERLI